MELKLDNKIKKTVLYNSHVELGAKLVSYGGYYMPISYSKGIQSEYFAVRKDVGAFDVSHMGEFFISGSESEKFLENITINNIKKLQVGCAQY